MVLPLQRGIIYGPVHSRRLGLSLGLNLMPVRRKVCSFDCVYCHFGPTDLLTCDLAPVAAELPTPDDVEQALVTALAGPATIEYITFSGNGEPSLHPEFPEIVRRVRRVRDRLRPDARVAVLSNSTGLARPAVADAFALLDRPIAKLDVGDEAMLHLVNRPAAGITLDELVRRLRSVRPVILQAIFLGGSVANSRGEPLARWIEQVTAIHPAEVHIYSLDRPAADPGLRLVLPADLAAIAAQTEKKARVRVRIFTRS